jgi:outer membrane protein assembly factor BamD (BamD/ComL family)
MKNLFILALLLLVAGCAGAPAAKADHARSNQTAAAEALGKSYRDAMAKNQRIAAENPRSEAAAEARFQMAYILTLPDNPQRDYESALQAFDDYLRRYPRHPRFAEAQSWRAVLKAIVDLRAENVRLTKVIDQLKTIDIQHEEKRAQ